MAEPMKTPKVWTIRVTDEDIRRGVPEDPYRCPVALALTREAPWVGGWKVSRSLTGYGIATLLPGFLDVRIRLSKAVGRFTDDFDEGRPVAPITFRVWH